MANSSDNPPAVERPPLAKPWAAWSAVFASLLLFSAVRSPVPGVNEPHYLCKAKHYWNPNWCAGDFFLDSSNTHLVFYQTVGILTREFTLAQTAWLGRLAALGLLAWGWVRWIPHLTPGRWTSLWAMWLFLALAAAGNWSGEWIIGGVEAKVFAYGWGFWAMAAWFDGRIKSAALLAGLAVSFHPVVGGWMAISAAFAGIITRLAFHANRAAIDFIRHSGNRGGDFCLGLSAGSLAGAGSSRRWKFKAGQDCDVDSNL